MSFMNIDYKKHMTNADRIRAMTDEELAISIDKLVSYECKNCPIVTEDCNDISPCKDLILKWLKQEAT